jgi:inosine-uridine nucleoside N-ribohydrolase
MKYILFYLFLWLAFGGYIVKAQPMNKTKAPLMIIFETDLGNDVDDALAMDMLYKYADDGLIKILAINSNKLSPYSYGMINIMNKWYGYPDIPFGKVDREGQDTAYNFAKAVCEFKVNNKPVFQTNISDNVEKATQVYRRILSKQPDHSVIIISTGFSTNLAKLLETKADKHSNLSGLDLISKKVKLLSVMAGNFEDPNFKEYNVVEDIPAAQKVFSSWPTPLVCSPFELGEKINYPGSSIANDFKWAPDHPMVIAYENYIKMPYDRPTWDLTSVLYAIEGRGAYFDESEKGKISVDDSGVTHFKADAKGKHQYLKAGQHQQELIKNRFLELITRKPGNLQ